MLHSTKMFALTLGLAALLTVGSIQPAHAAPAGALQTPVLTKLEWPKLDNIAPKVKFKAKAKLKKNTVKLSLAATITVAGKSFRVPIFDMGLKKSKKSVKVQRKVGKLKVSLKISWQGERQITIKGTAKYMKFKLPVPPIKLKI